MFSKNYGRIFTLGIVLAFIASNVDAQETVYKWVDEDGVVHFSDEPPGESTATEIEILTTTKAPPFEPTDQPPIKLAPIAEADGEKRSAQPESELPALVEKADTATMSLADLDRRCEDAREKMIAPLREAEITKCKQQEDSDPARCERFYADFGDGGKTMSGTFRPRMFNDLSECIEADQEKRKRKQ